MAEGLRDDRHAIRLLRARAGFTAAVPGRRGTGRGAQHGRHPGAADQRRVAVARHARCRQGTLASVRAIRRLDVRCGDRHPARRPRADRQRVRSAVRPPKTWPARRGAAPSRQSASGFVSAGMDRGTKSSAWWRTSMPRASTSRAPATVYARVGVVPPVHPGGNAAVRRAVTFAIRSPRGTPSGPRGSGGNAPNVVISGRRDRCAGDRPPTRAGACGRRGSSPSAYR